VERSPRAVQVLGVVPMSKAFRVLAILVVFLVSGVPSSEAAIPPGRLAIGDSVMLAAKEELTARGFRVSASISRQFRDSVPLVRRLKEAGKLRRTVVIHLGTQRDPDPGG